MSAPLPYEPNRFRTAAAHYLAGRPAYAPRLIARVVQLTALPPHALVIDLGCGPAQLACAFAPHAARVLAIDPSADMLAEAARHVPANVTLAQASSYDLTPAHGPAHLVTIGRAFHWMDRADTLHRLDGIVTPEGWLALFHDTHPDLPENAWHTEYWAILRRYAADDTTRQRWQGPGWTRHETFLLNSPFNQLEEIAVIERRPLTTATLIDRALSLSTTSRARLGPRADAMIADIQAFAAATAPGGHFTEAVSTSALLARRG